MHFIHPLSKAREVLTFYDAYARSAPDEVTVDALIATSPEGEPIIEISACYIGSLDVSERMLQPLRRFGTPLMNDLHPIAYADLQALGDGAFPAGMYYYWTSQSMTEISPAAIDTLASQFAHVPSKRSAVLFQQLGGAISRIDPTATAFYHRNAQYDCIMISAWTDSATLGRRWNPS